MLKPEFEDELQKYIAGISKRLNQQLISINTMPDHCHLLVRLRPSMAPSVFIQKVKAGSSNWINEKGFLKSKFHWQAGGGIFSVSSKDVSMVAEYIDNQKEHHKKIDFRDEYITFLKHYGIEFDEKYLLDFL